MALCLALFDESSSGVSLVGEVRDPDLIRAAWERLAAARRSELNRLEPPRPIRPIRPQGPKAA